MSIELSEFYQTFYDEASEHLAEMESLLLELDIEAPDLDHMNAIFRAAHSIKGGAGMFGFNEMVEVAHILETLLDKLRKGELAFTEAMVDAFLQSADIIKGQIAARQGADAVPESDVQAICATLKQLSEGQTVAAAPVEAAPEVASTAAETSANKGEDSYVIRFSRDGNKLELPASFDWLTDSLQDLGPTEVVESGIQKGSHALLKVSRSVALADIHEAFSMFLQANEYEIDPAAGDNTHKETAAPVAAVVEDDPSFGLFDMDEPVATPAVATPEVAKKAVVEDDPSFGFFVDSLPIVEAPAAPVAVATPAPEQPKAEVQAAPAPVKAAASPAKSEEAAPAAKAGAAADTSIRVNVEKVDQLINLAGELVITQAMLAQTASEVDPVIHEKLISGIALLERNTRDLQEAIMSIRMVPMSFVFSRFPRMVRDISAKLHKDITLKTQGENTELDKGLIEKITDPLTHLVRNSLDHGIEAPQARIDKGKDPKGNLILRAFHQGGNVVIEVQDDGGGLNRAKILTKARERNLPVSDSMSDQDVWQLIFAPGFSTADQVTDVSGRGVGMDVVKKNIQSLGGRVEIESYEGLGTKITIRLPLTLAILDGLSIAVGEETFIIPITSIIESLQPSPKDVKAVAGHGRVIHVRGEYLPLIALYDVFDIEPRSYDPNKGTLMIVESEGSKSALLVDELLGQHQVVIKSLESNYRKVQGISGATIMGDGRVALILDVAAVMRIGKTLEPRMRPTETQQDNSQLFAHYAANHDPNIDNAWVSAIPKDGEEVIAPVQIQALTKLEDAVAAHTKWRTRLRQVLDGHGEKLDPDNVGKDNACDLGKWIYGDGAQYAKLPEFRQLKEQHAKFHRCACEVLKKSMSGDKQSAENMLGSNGNFSNASGETVTAIRRLQKAVENSRPVNDQQMASSSKATRQG